MGNIGTCRYIGCGTHTGSLLNNPRLIPCINAMPIPPLNACSQPKAFAIINSINFWQNAFAFYNYDEKGIKKMYPQCHDRNNNATYFSNTLNASEDDN